MFLQPDHEKKEANSVAHTNANMITNQFPTELQQRNYKRWLRTALYAVFVLAGQATATLLGRLYYDKGGKSKWTGTLVQLVGFPVLIPYYFICILSKNPTSNGDHFHPKKPSLLVLSSAYVGLGLLIAGVCFLSSVGLSYLPLSTFSLIFASQLGFTSIFSFFLNSQKFTPFILNSVVLLTVASVLLIVQSNGSGASPGVSRGKYAIAFICTVGASAGTGLSFASTQFVFRKVIKVKKVEALIEIIIFQCLVASCVTMVGLFACGEWKGLRIEIEEFELGKVSYVMTLVWTAICWQVFAIGSVGLICELSSLFSNVISALCLPLVQVLAVLTFNDKMDGLKGISLFLAIWGFASYIYQHYLEDYCKSNTDDPRPNEE